MAFSQDNPKTKAAQPTLTLIQLVNIGERVVTPGTVHKGVDNNQLESAAPGAIQPASNNSRRKYRDIDVAVQAGAAAFTDTATTSPRTIQSAQ